MRSLDLVAYLLQVALHGCGVLAADDVEQFIQFSAYAFYLGGGAGVEEDLL